MKITKYETNFRWRLFFKKTENISFKEDTKNEENNLINIYPQEEFQSIIGVGGALTRCFLL